MADATVTTTLTVTKDNTNYQSRPTQFTASMSASKGPSPGAVAVSTDGTDIDLTELDSPGLCRLMNLDSTNYVELGIWDGVSFYPIMELLPGETYVIRLARNLEEEYGTGTGTTGDAINTLRAKANTAACNLLVEAFER